MKDEMVERSVHDWQRLHAWYRREQRRDRITMIMLILMAIVFAAIGVVTFPF